jgi:4-amino-4-deoxy-L-arabinose transferase-like glycosyltransferase
MKKNCFSIPIVNKNVLFLIFWALLIKVFHAWELNHSVLGAVLIGDELTHQAWTEDLKLGKFLDLAPFFRAPLYGFFVSGIQFFAVNALEAVRSVQFLLGVLSVLLIYGIGLQCFSPRVAFFSAFFSANYGLLTYFEGQLLLEPLYIFLSLCGLYTLHKAYTLGQSKMISLSAACFGLACLTRPNLLLFLPLALLVLLRKKNILKTCLFFLLPLVFLFTPVALVNTIQDGRFCFLSTQGGINFYVGNNADADGIIPCVPLSPSDISHTSPLKEIAWKTDNLWQAMLLIPSAETGKHFSESEASRWWYGKTWESIFKNPLVFLERIFKKTLFLVGAIEPWNNTDPKYVCDNYFPCLRVLNTVFNFFTLWILFLPGIVRAWTRYPQSRFLMVYLLVMAVSVILFFVNSRFRLPMIPIMTCFAAVSLEWIWDCWKNPKFFWNRKMLGYCLGAMLLSQSYRFYPESAAMQSAKALFHNSLAEAHLGKKDAEGALFEIRQSLSIPTAETFIFLHTLAKIQWRLLHKTEEAIATLEKSIALTPHSITLSQLAAWYSSMGNKEKSRAALEQLKSLKENGPLPLAGEG